MWLWLRVESCPCFVLSKLRLFLLARQNRVGMCVPGSNLAGMFLFFGRGETRERWGIGWLFLLIDEPRAGNFVLKLRHESWRQQSQAASLHFRAREYKGARRWTFVRNVVQFCLGNEQEAYATLRKAEASAKIPSKGSAPFRLFMSWVKPRPTGAHEGYRASRSVLGALILLRFRASLDGIQFLDDRGTHGTIFVCLGAAYLYWLHSGGFTLSTSRNYCAGGLFICVGRRCGP